VSTLAQQKTIDENVAVFWPFSVIASFGCVSSTADRQQSMYVTCTELLLATRSEPPKNVLERD